MKYTAFFVQEYLQENRIKMKEGQSSRTALLPVQHFQNTQNPVFSDPYSF